MEEIHGCGFVYRDAKPTNFLVGRKEKAELVHVVDFGLAKRYKDLKSGKHVEPKKGRRFTGTARYASINAHMGLEQSRRDDLESICYVAIYFLKGKLPWQGIKEESKEKKYSMIAECKKTSETLLNDLPEELKTMLSYCKSLKFETEPDYKYIRGLIREVLAKEKLEYNRDFDWIQRKSIAGVKYPSTITEDDEPSKIVKKEITPVKKPIKQEPLTINYPSPYHSVGSPKHGKVLEISLK
eukprot:TRINITY_DN7964_c0_g3_i1.p2 TRINITY_DN7964_c0_g3~~TRINITY_DN7964_c0_g3_i1.p2  ORF type:complete len:240 (+),score=51.72 TRINITY_DN7964_c0_g3_i1:457-1176(+)